MEWKGGPTHPKLEQLSMGLSMYKYLKEIMCFIHFNCILCINHFIQDKFVFVHFIFPVEATTIIHICKCFIYFFDAACYHHRNMMEWKREERRVNNSIFLLENPFF